MPVSVTVDGVSYSIPLTGEDDWGDDVTSWIQGISAAVEAAAGFSLAAVGSTPNANGASYSSGVFNLQPASTSFPGVMSAADKTKLNNIESGAINAVAGAGMTKSGSTLNVVANADGSIMVNADDIQVGILATDAQHGTRGGGTLHATAVSGGAAGFMSGADKTKLDGIASGATAGVTTIGAVGASPNSAGGSISGTTLTLQPADASNPGLLTSGTQTFGGTKSITGSLAVGGAFSPDRSLHVLANASGEAVAWLKNTHAGGISSIGFLGEADTASVMTFGIANSAVAAPRTNVGHLSMTSTHDFVVTTTASHVERLRIKTGGDVTLGSSAAVTFDAANGWLGIGAAPTRPLYVLGTEASNVFGVRNTNTSGFAGVGIWNESDVGQAVIGYCGTAVSSPRGGNVGIFSINNSDIVFTTTASHTERMRIANTTGNVSVQQALNVIGNITQNGVAVPTISSTSTLTNKTISGGTFSGTIAGSPTFSGTVTFSPVGLIATKCESVTTNPADSGFIRLARANTICWRNNAASGNVTLGVSTSNRLQFEAADIPTVSSTDTLTNKTLTSPTINTPDLRRQQRAITAATTLAITTDEIVRCDATSAAFTVTLPTAVGNAGKKFTVLKTDSSANAVTVDGNASETINGSLTYVVRAQYQQATIVSDGSNWLVINESFPRVYARYTTNAGQSIASTGAVATIVDFEDVDTDPRSAVTTGAAWKFTCPTGQPGLYEIVSTVTWSTVSGTIGMSLYKSGTFVQTLFLHGNATSTNQSMSGSTMVRLAAGEFVDIRIHQVSGASRTLTANTQDNWIAINRVAVET